MTNQLAISVKEKRRLEACESDIDKGGNLIVQGLSTIRDERLYRSEFTTFEEYCETRWGLSKTHANRLIAHGRVLDNLTADADLAPIGVKLTEAATREIADLPPETQREVMREVVKVEPRKPTAKAIKQVREQIENEKSPSQQVADFFGKKTGSQPTTPTTSTASIVLDAGGRNVPDHLRPDYSGAALIQSLATKVERLRSELNSVSGERGLQFLEYDIAPLLDVLLNVKDRLRSAMFASECPQCRRNVKPDCGRCEGTGFIPVRLYQSLSKPEEAYLEGLK